MLSSQEAWHTERQLTRHADYAPVRYNKQQHVVISKVNFRDGTGQSLKLQKNKKAAMMLQDHEKQVYHELEPLKQEVREFEPAVVPLDYPSKFDTHRLVTTGPRGMDQIQQFQEQVYGI